MGFFGELLSIPVKLANVPLKVAEDVMEELTGGKDNLSENNRIISKPLDFVAEQIKKIDD